MNTKVTNESIERKDAKVLLEDNDGKSKITFTDKIIFSNGRDKAKISVDFETTPEGRKKYISILDVSNTNKVDMEQLKSKYIILDKEKFQKLLQSTGAELL